MMTREEILLSFTEAKNPVKQVPILADLNDTTVAHIRKILIEMGVDQRKLPRKKKAKEAPAVTEVTEVTEAATPTDFVEVIQAEYKRLAKEQSVRREELARIKKEYNKAALVLDALDRLIGIYREPEWTEDTE